MTDTLAISTPALQSTRGRTEASVVMFFGSFTGGYIVSRFIPLIMTDLLLALTIFALIGLIPLGLVAFLKEQESAKVEGDKARPSIWGIVKENFGYSFVRWGLLFAFVLNIDGGLLELTLEPYLGITLGVPIQAVVADLFYISMIGYVIAFLGYFFIDKIDKSKMLIIIALTYIVPLALLGYFTLTSTLTYTLFLWLYGVFSLVTGLSFVTYTGLFFDLSNPKAAGTMIAFFLTITNLGRLMGIMLGGFFTMSTIYFIAVGLTAFRILPLLKIRATEIEKTFYAERPKRPFAKRDILVAAIPLAVLILFAVLHVLGN
jgi:MFS family permease